MSRCRGLSACCTGASKGRAWRRRVGKVACRGQGHVARPRATLPTRSKRRGRTAWAKAQERFAELQARRARLCPPYRTHRIEKENPMHRRRFLTSAAAAAGAAQVGRIAPARAARELLVAEPVHSTGYLPLYIPMAKGYFEDVKVNLVPIETGSGPTKPL